MKIITAFLKRKKVLKECIKHHVSNGLFLIEKGHFFKLSILSFFTNLYKLHKYYLIFSKNKRFNYENGKLIFGSKKLCFLADDRAFVFYLDKKDFNRAINIMESNYYQIKYPLFEVLHIDQETFSFETELVDKKRDYIDDDYYRISALLLNESFLPDTQGKLKVGNRIVLSYLQHGDCHYNNFMLTSNDYGFTVIDIDDIGVFPAFYDFFYFCSFAKRINFNALIEADNVASLMNKILSKCGFPTLNNVVDYYLSVFVDFYSAKMNKYNKTNIITILSWMKDFNVLNYPLTEKSIEYFNSICVEVQ